MPLSMETPVAFVTAQRITALWPRSTLEGSMVKVMAGLSGAPGAAAGACPGAGGGAGATGGFLLQAEAKSIRANEDASKPRSRIFIVTLLPIRGSYSYPETLI